MVYKVAVVKVKNDVDTAVKTAIKLVDDFSPSEGAKIVIKPNLCSSKSSSESGVTTDVQIVEAVIKYLKKRVKRCQITIVESDSDGTADEAFKRLGYKDLQRKHDIRLSNLSKDKTVKMLISDGSKLMTLDVPETLLLMDYFISIAKLKTHVFEKFSGVWKNQYGCIPKKRVREQLHPFLSEALYDLNKIFHPDLSIMDGIIALEGPGPIEGTPKRLGVIICSKNPLSLDIVASRIMGVKPHQIPHIKYALKHGFRDAKDISVVGEGHDILASNPHSFKTISTMQYRFYRASLYLRRISAYLHNAGNLASAYSFAARTVGLSQLAKGNILFLKDLLHEIKDLLFKVEASSSKMMAD